MELHNLKNNTGARKKRKRVGRGPGSGHGKTSCRGHNGQKSRSGYSRRLSFEGGQMPIQRRLPKRGFNSLTKAYNATIRTSELNKLDEGVVDLLTLKAANLISEISLTAKVFLSGEVTKKFTLEGVAFTKGAKAAIEKAGGKVQEVKEA